jgi:hypothetical protein
MNGNQSHPRRTMTLLSRISALRSLVIIVTGILLSAGVARAQTTDDFQTHQTGNWNSTTTWERWNGSAWITPAPSTPTNANGVITILNGHTVTVTANVTADQVVVGTGAQVTLPSGDTLTISNGTGTDLSVSGLFNNSGTITRNTGATIVFNSGSTFQHAVDGGTIPTATWNANSICMVTGTVATLPNGLNQTFGHLTWNCNSQTTNLTLSNTLAMNGTLTIQSTGTTGEFRFASGTNTIGGSYTQSAGSVRVAGGSNRTITVAGNFSMSGGTLEMADNASIGLVNIAGNFSQTAGTITETGTSTTSGIVFTGSGTQTFTSGGTIANRINLTVNNSSTLQVTPGSTLQVNNTSTLTLGSALVNGAGNFTLSSGATIVIGSPNGIAASSASGNIQVTGTRSFSTGANYTYSGSSPQVTGDGLPSTVSSLTVNNTSGVTLGSNVAVTANLTVLAGIFDLSTFTANRASPGGTLTVSNGAALKIGGTNSFPSNYNTHTLGAASTVEYNGTNQTVTNESYGHLSLSNGGTKTMPASALSVAGNFSTSGSASTAAAGAFTVAGTFSIGPTSTYSAGTFAHQLGGDWTNSGTFNYGTSTVTFQGAALQHVGASTFYAVIVNNAAGLSLTGDVQIATGGIMTLTSGNVATAGHILTVNASAPTALVLGANSITGTVARAIAPGSTGTYQFFGANAYVIPGGTGNPSMITATVYPNTNPPNLGAGADTNVIVKRYYTISGTGIGGGFFYTMRLSYAQSEVRGNEATYTMWENSGAVWVDVGLSSAPDTANNFAEQSGLTGFSDWTVASTTSALPIQLASFQGAVVAHSSDVRLTWTTLSELNNYGFYIQRSSAPSSGFVDCADNFVRGSGTSLTPKQYAWTEKNMTPGTYYYRLKQADLDGSITMSDPVKVVVETPTGVDNGRGPEVFALSQNYPNPFNPTTRIQFSVEQTAHATLIVYNILGDQVATLFTGTAEAGKSYTVAFDGSNLANGAYFCRLVSGEKTELKKMILLK